MDDATAGPRLRDLAETLTRLTAHHDALAALPAPRETTAINEDDVRRLGQHLLQTITDGDPVTRKRVIEALIAEVRVTGPGHLVPVFRISGGDTGVHDGQVGTPGAPPSTPLIMIDGPVVRVRQLRGRRGEAAQSGQQM